MKALAADDPRAIGEYRLRGQLGSGGMGRVYLGLSPAGRAVAIKVVQPSLAQDAEFLRRFRQEVALARSVSGFYTAPVVASGLEENPPWLATAFVPGPSLAQMITDHGPLPEASLWPLLGGLVEALAAIHACGVVHRDLKPANVLLATDGPRVIDFGISRAADGISLTATGVVFGTPGYLSPEQAEGKPAGPASDMFALGCVIAYAARGAGPFGGGTAASILYRVVHDDPDLDGISGSPGVPARLREIVLACLAKDPAARPTPRSLSGAIADGMRGSGSSAVAFWPRPTATLIAAYQAQLEQETQVPGQSAEFSWATLVHPPTTLPAQGGGAGSGSSAGPAGPASPAGPAGPGGPPGPGWPPQPPPVSPGGPPVWPYAPPSGASPAMQSVPNSYGVASPAAPGGLGSQGSAAPDARGYPAPQGYGGAQAPSAPPRGYLPASGATPAYPPPYPVTPGSSGASRPLGSAPASVLTAVRLMYAGAVYSFIYAIAVIAIAASIINKHPLLTVARASSGHATVAGVAFLAVVTAVIAIALWLWLASACKRGKNWARITGTVLFGVYTLGTLSVLANPHRDIGLAKLMALVGWLIAGSAVLFLWRRQSGAFFHGTTPAGG